MKRGVSAQHLSGLRVGRILGMRVDATSYDEAVALISGWARKGQSRYICEAPVHTVMETRAHPAFHAVIETADLVTPGGMPLVWMLRLLGFSKQPRVYGPELMLRSCAAAASAKLRVGLYGSTSGVIAKLSVRLRKQFPGLEIVYAYSPPFRNLLPEEERRTIDDINDSGVQILFVGLGCPKQEKWMAEHRGRVSAVMLGVGAAFDFLSGNKRQAPVCLQALGLEWLFRLGSEPRRLWFRYLYYNPIFAVAAGAQLFKHVLLKGRRPATFSDDSVRRRGTYSIANTPKLPSALNIYGTRGKRLFDLLFAAVSLALLLPVLLIISLAIRVTSPGPIFYVQRRVGQRGKEFVMVKFRSMHFSACTKQPVMVAGALQKGRQDGRTTPVGRFLRRFSFDELPQLWNVLRGEMSIVGPRPLPSCMLAGSSSLLAEREQVRPGITGLWQIRAREHNRFLKDMISHDLEYIRDVRFRNDCRILVRTVVPVVVGRGAV